MIVHVVQKVPREDEIKLDLESRQEAEMTSTAETLEEKCLDKNDKSKIVKI